MNNELALHAALAEITRPLRRIRGAAQVLGGAAAITMIFAVAVWGARTGWLSTPIEVLVAWVALLCIAGWTAMRSWRAFRTARAERIGERLEQDGAWRAGAITTLLGAQVNGTSSQLHAAAQTQRAAEVRGRGADVLSGDVARARVAVRRYAAIAALGIACVIAARPATGAPARVWRPLDAWRALVAPVRIHARNATVKRGETALLDVTALGRRSATLYTRTPGEAWRTTTVALDANGNATISTEPLAADLIARVEAGGRSSDEVRISIWLAAFLGAFTASAHYPKYLALDDEALPTTGDTLVIPEGTELTIAGRATTALADAVLAGPEQRTALSVSAMTFRGVVVPKETGTWRLALRTENNAPLEGDVPSLPIRVIPDSAPVVQVPVPGSDTVASVALSLAVVVGIRDDHGIVAAAFEGRRGALGQAVRVTLPLPQATSDRALITTAIDLQQFGLHPGDTLHYVAIATDNAPAHHVGRSKEFLLRVPTEAEQRAARSQETAAAAVAFDSVSRQAARVQRTEEDLAKERQRVDPKAPTARAGDDGQKEPLTSDAARKAAAAAQAQQQVIDDAAKLQQKVQELRDAAQQSGASDSSLARDLNEINKLLDKALSPELRDKLLALHQSIKSLDADQTRQSLQDLAKQQAQLKDAMDQARELFKRAALETDLSNMGKDAKALATAEHDVARDLGRGDSTAVHAQEALAKRADSLAAGLDRAAEQTPAQQSKEGLQQAAQQARDASSKMQQAAKAGEAGKQAEAQGDAKQAEEQLNPLSKKIEDNKEQMQAEMRADVKQALDRALQETARLAQKQLALVQAFQQGALMSQTRIDQGIVEEGAAKLAQQVAAVAAKNALVSPQAAIGLAEARRLMREAVDAVSTVNPNSRDAFEKSGDAVDALAVAAYSLMQSKDKVDGSQSGSGMQEAMQQMQQMAGKQGQMAQQGAGMMQQGNMNAQQMLQLALQQRALAQQMERMRAGGQLPGAGQMAREARELSKALEAGRLNQDVVDRQQKLFKRMLDAGRLLQGEEDDDKKERQSSTAKDAKAATPPPMDPALRNGTGEIRLPGWESLQHLSPEERRRVIEYFQRLSQGGHP